MSDDYPVGVFHDAGCEPEKGERCIFNLGTRPADLAKWQAGSSAGGIAMRGCGKARAVQKHQVEDQRSLLSKWRGNSPRRKDRPDRSLRGESRDGPGDAKSWAARRRKTYARGESFLTAAKALPAGGRPISQV